MRQDVDPIDATVEIPGLAVGRYRVTAWDTVGGRCRAEEEVEIGACQMLRLPVAPLVADLALAVRQLRRS